MNKVCDDADVPFAVKLNIYKVLLTSAGIRGSAGREA